MVVSSNSSYPIDKIGGAATGPFWFQLYVGPDKDVTREKVERALAAGAKAICWTVDGPYQSHRERLLRDRVATSGPPAPAAAQPGRRRTMGLKRWRSERRLCWSAVRHCGGLARSARQAFSA